MIMKTLSIPVRVVEADSEPLQYLDMPRDMNTFQMPLVPERVDSDALAQSRLVLAQFLREVEVWDQATDVPGPRLDLGTVSPAALAVTNQMLGEGEVSVRISGARALRIQESVFAGIWRVCEFDPAGVLCGDWIEAGALPEIVLQAAHAAAAPAPVAVALPEGAMNSPALVHEIGDRVRERKQGAATHVVNLTLFPMTPDDHVVLEQALPVGPVAIISRGFGNCRITSTLVRDVWRVQYFNSMNTLILNTLEIVEAPEVALAAAEDLLDSRERLAELIAWMGES
jgi:hydrogenase-1 operon protein HyaF